MTMRFYRIISAFALFLILGYEESRGQELATNQPLCDSLVVEDPDGSRTVTYTFLARPAEISAPQTSSLTKRQYLTSEADVEQKLLSLASRRMAPARVVSGQDLSGYSVGSIPIQASVSSTGARLYSIPISVVSGWKLVPELSLVYNSQSGNNIAGFGWGLSGLSSIEVRNKNYYYDGCYRGGVYDSSDAEYSLDGVPIVRSALGLSGYSYATKNGNIQVQKHLVSSGTVAYFTVLYPNGMTGTFGYSDNTKAKNTYPLTELTDIEGNTITFSYSYIAGSYYINEIDYGKNASIIFSWEFRPDGTPYLYSSSGLSVSFPYKILKTITCNDGENEVYKYNLTHEVKDDVSLLKKVECSTSSNNLPPLSFSYGIDSEEDTEVTHTFHKVDESIFVKYFTKSDDCSLIYKRGKLIPGSQNDGVVILPSFDTYAQIGYTKKWYELHRSYKYGSKYSKEQEILCNISGYYSSAQKVILAEEGFQLIEAVDVNGDGTDELVKVNSGCTTKGVTDFKITTYSFDRNGVMSSQNFTISINDGTSNTYYNNPAKCFYRFGNFRGDGKSMLLIMSRDASKFALVDLNTKRKVSESTLFSMSDEEINLVLAADFENDGQTDLCHITDEGMDVYSLSAMTGNTFSLRTSYSGISKYALYMEPIYNDNGAPASIPANLYLLDTNDDGYLDIAAAPAFKVKGESFDINSNTWNIARFDGDGFYTQTISLFVREEDDTIIFLDADKDGLPDMLHLRRDSVLFLVPNINGTYKRQVSYSGITLDETSDLIPGDISIFGTHGDVIVASGAYISLYNFDVNHSDNRKLVQMTDSFGHISTNTYGKITDSDGSYLADLNRSYSTADGFMRCHVPLTVLVEGRTYFNNKLLENNYYTYWDVVSHNKGLGFCGFGKIRTIDYVSGTYTTKVLDPEKLGVVSEISIARSYNGAPYSTVANTYDNNSSTYGKLNPRLVKSVESNSLTGIEVTTTYTYGDYDLPTTILTSRRIGNGTAQTEKLLRTYENSISASKYVLGVVTEESIIKGCSGSDELSWKEKSVNTYDDHYRNLTQKHYVGYYGVPRFSKNEAVEESADVYSDYLDSSLGDVIRISYDATNLVLEKRWRYDDRGNVVSEETAPYGATEFTGNAYTYDSDGRYLLTKTDALGHTTTFSGYNKFGKPAASKDYRHRETTYSYDSWGDLISTFYPDGSNEQTTVSWGGVGLYTVTSISTGKPRTITHCDDLGREIKSGVERFDGQWQWVDKEYDSRGRLSRVSLPYREEAASYWNTYSYDDYNRQTSITEASGKVSSWSYDGTSVTSVKDGITSTSTTDANGNVISVTDAGGTITYAFRNDGQPSVVTAPGNVKTTFTYDDYGRRVKIEDPSAGIQIDSCVWNSDGSSVQTHTNPNGSIITYKDKYGRTTSVERPGEYNTTYAYDDDGHLISEQSTNGTGAEYTYDNLDRVVTSREIVPDGKWLRKNYGYGSHGELLSVQYVSQDGAITTENFAYANGHNTGITLQDGTIVYNLVSENDLGMTTEIISGGVDREYGFTAFGLPAYRKIDDGNLQDFTYQFDPLTGNLLVRTDGSNNQTEQFGYDNLNRLTSIGNRVIAYADNGNITSMDGVGMMEYGTTSRPYQITSLYPESDNVVPSRVQNVSYTCYSRPSILTEGGRSAAFTYDGDGNRVKMYVADGSTQLLTRYYVGDRYEFDQTSGGTKERLYLGGDAYSAPMVLQRENGGEWTAYNICRDYLGSITHIASLDGTLVAEYSYDPWGRLRDPETLEVYAAGEEPELFLGRGFTGHEHLTWFGLINMNARLYDPLLGRFLSPDPYVQAPDFTQNFNRYSYALNNPLKFTDDTGEFALTTMLTVAAITAAVFGLGNVGAHMIRDDISFYDGVKYFFSGAVAGFFVGAAAYTGWCGIVGMSKMAGFLGTVGKIAKYGAICVEGVHVASTITGAVGGAINKGGKGFINSMKVLLGNFYLDENASFFKSIWQGVSRHTWETIQTGLGYDYTQFRNAFGSSIDRVDYYRGATFATNENSRDYQGVTIGSFINMDINGKIPSGKFDDYVEKDDQMYAHEYGHTIQSRRFGLGYPIIGLLSLGSAMFDFVFNTGHSHDNFFTEVMANKYAEPIFPNYQWGTTKYPTKY